MSATLEVFSLSTTIDLIGRPWTLSNFARNRRSACTALNVRSAQENRLAGSGIYICMKAGLNYLDIYMFRSEHPARQSLIFGSACRLSGRD